jgi:hypothetical protein
MDDRLGQQELGHVSARVCARVCSRAVVCADDLLRSRSKPCRRGLGVRESILHERAAAACPEVVLTGCLVACCCLCCRFGPLWHGPVDQGVCWCMGNAWRLPRLTEPVSKLVSNLLVSLHSACLLAAGVLGVQQCYPLVLS